MITIKTIKWRILLFINNFERKQRSNSAYQLSIPISNFEYAFTYWVKKTDLCLCFVQEYYKCHQNDVIEVALISWLLTLSTDQKRINNLVKICDETFFKNN